VVDDDNTTATDTDDATVTLTNVPPTVDVVKTAAPESRPAPGGAFTFTVVVKNTSAEPITIRTLTDDIYGNIATQGTCTTAVGTILAPQATYTCSFTGSFAGASGSQKDVVTVTVVDNEGTTATDNDDATVTITPPTTGVEGQTLVNTVPTATTPTTTTTTSTLARTGANVGGLLTLGLGLLAFGGLLLVAGSHVASDGGGLGLAGTALLARRLPARRRRR
jgi:hypothetical protein